MIFRLLPGGWTLISMPQFRMSSGSSSSRVAFPPPKSSVKVPWKASLILINWSAKIRSISPVTSAMTFSSSVLDWRTSSRWPVK